jgi:hypothetical protein
MNRANIRPVASVIAPFRFERVYMEILPSLIIKIKSRYLHAHGSETHINILRVRPVYRRANFCINKVLQMVENFGDFLYMKGMKQSVARIEIQSSFQSDKDHRQCHPRQR